MRRHAELQHSVTRGPARRLARSLFATAWLVFAGCATDPPPPAATPAQAPATAPTQEPAPPEAAASAATEEPQPECQANEDCGKARGDAPAGNEWICESGTCATRTLPEPVKAEPAAEEPKAGKSSKKGKKAKGK